MIELLCSTLFYKILNKSCTVKFQFLFNNTTCLFMLLYNKIIKLAIIMPSHKICLVFLTAI